MPRYLVTFTAEAGEIIWEGELEATEKPGADGAPDELLIAENEDLPESVHEAFVRYGRLASHWTKL